MKDWERFNLQNKTLKKKAGLYEIENIDNVNILTLAINPKEYFEKYRNYSLNKNHKGMNKNTGFLGLFRKTGNLT